MAKDTTPSTEAQTVTLTKDKECKGSVRYATADFEAVVSNVYLSRSFARPMPDSITVTIRAGGAQ